MLPNINFLMKKLLSFGIILFKSFSLIISTSNSPVLYTLIFLKDVLFSKNLIDLVKKFPSIDKKLDVYLNQVKLNKNKIISLIIKKRVY